MTSEESEGSVRAHEARRERLRQLTGEAMARFSERKRTLHVDDRAPAPGDLFLLASGEGSAVEWLAIDDDPIVERLLVVPADTNPAVGSGDVVVPVAPASAPLTLRCRFGTWIDGDIFSASMRTSRLDPEVVERACRKWIEVQQGAVTGSEHESEEDEDGEYLEWQEIVRREQARLVRHIAWRAAGESAARDSAPAKRSWHVPPWLGLAASLVLTLGLTATVVWQEGRLAETARQHEAAQEALRRELGEVRLERAEQPRVNPPLATLRASEAVRGEGETLSVPAGSGPVHLFFEVDDPWSYERYEVTMFREEGNSEPIWRSGPITDGVDRLSLSVPSQMLAEGEYRFVLSALQENGAKRLAEYALRVVRD